MIVNVNALRRVCYVLPLMSLLITCISMVVVAVIIINVVVVVAVVVVVVVA